ncbi:uncharacterized protein LOC117195082 [Drosophila miranda]|uniref:uncharacterized protein LOC117195082 n=1 Tax=Drosophila miranda TaxID=7229 RepID=UPI00143F2767|nr:uncharacterized protein LOC117195082 [Drosophila miranda]
MKMELRRASQQRLWPQRINQKIPELACRPKESRSINGPSGCFAMTRDWALPPVDLQKPIGYLCHATPIHEEPQESRCV